MPQRSSLPGILNVPFAAAGQTWDWPVSNNTVPQLAPSTLHEHADGRSSEQHADLVVAIKKATSDWLAQLARMQQSETEFAARLAACKNPSDAITLCGSWLGHRVDSAVSMQHRLIDLWLEAMAPELHRQPTGRAVNAKAEESRLSGQLSQGETQAVQNTDQFKVPEQKGA